MGLRLGEALALTVADIDRPINVCTSVRQARATKTDSCRYPSQHSRRWLISGVSTDTPYYSPAEATLQQQPVDGSGGIQTTIRLAAKDAGISKGSMCILLRHSYATHLLSLA